MFHTSLLEIERLWSLNAYPSPAGGEASLNTFPKRPLISKHSVGGIPPYNIVLTALRGSLF